MGKLIKLNIVAPGREVLTEEVISLSTTEFDGKIEILANYAPTIIATIPTIIKFFVSVYNIIHNRANITAKIIHACKLPLGNKSLNADIKYVNNTTTNVTTADIT